MTRVTVGQYYPGDSLVHRLDPRVKLVSVLAYITLLFFADNGAGYAVAACFMAFCVALSRVPVRLVLRGLRPVLFVLVFAGALNVFLTPGETVLFALTTQRVTETGTAVFTLLRVTREGVVLAASMALRLTLLVFGSSLLTLSTSPIALADAIESLLNPLRVIKVPAHEIAMMMTIALRFIPTLADETEKIMKAQTARGADFTGGGLLKRAKNLVPLLVPLFVSAFRRADELATAMDARCYRGGENRTKMKVMQVTATDKGAMTVVALLAVLLLLTRYFFRG